VDLSTSVLMKNVANYVKPGDLLYSRS